MGSNGFFLKLTFHMNKTFKTWGKSLQLTHALMRQNFEPIWSTLSCHLPWATTKAWHFRWSLTGGSSIHTSQTFQSMTSRSHKYFRLQHNISMSSSKPGFDIFFLNANIKIKVLLFLRVLILLASFSFLLELIFADQKPSAKSTKLNPAKW